MFQVFEPVLQKKKYKRKKSLSSFFFFLLYIYGANVHFALLKTEKNERKMRNEK